MQITLRRGIVLTTASPASRYGVPALRIAASRDTHDYGPADTVDVGALPHGLLVEPDLRPWYVAIGADRRVYAAGVVYAYARILTGAGRLTEGDRGAIVAYLRQWPDGPQLAGEGQ